MIYLLLGSDDFSKREFINNLRAVDRAELLDITEPDPKLIIQAANAQSLFEGRKIVRVNNLAGKLEMEELIEKILKTQNIVLFIESSLDKRKTESKKLLASKNITVREFVIPKGAALGAWIDARAKSLELKVNSKARSLFLQKIGADAGGFGDPNYDLWQINSELEKLKVFAGDREVSPEDVQSLVSENLDEDIFKITNAIADKQKKLTVKYLTDYIDRMAGSDEKSKIISLSGIIAEQFRGILMLQGMLDENLSEAEIIKQTGFSSGKFFIYKKLSRQFTSDRLLDALKKLELLDVETKTSSNPAALQFFMIINSVMS